MMLFELDQFYHWWGGYESDMTQLMLCQQALLTLLTSLSSACGWILRDQIMRLSPLLCIWNTVHRAALWFLHRGLCESAPCCPWLAALMLIESRSLCVIHSLFLWQSNWFEIGLFCSSGSPLDKVPFSKSEIKYLHLLIFEQKWQWTITEMNCFLPGNRIPWGQKFLLAFTWVTWSVHNHNGIKYFTLHYLWIHFGIIWYFV